MCHRHIILKFASKRMQIFYLNDFDLTGRPASDEQCPLHVSVNRLNRVLGRSSSVMLELRAVFQNPRWHTAWLYLIPTV